ncbi:Anoctamin-8 [Eumeta japonica]|uniref:Anoctamin n=1 Tax=Eumeta variegata TaxID=151549 RepID=A0A4C1TSP6_EUMVA|nr:Anoctamin-8 [Eumeta japonica]
MSLFYIAFYLQDMDKLKEQLAVLLITRQIIGNLKESAVPYLIENLRLAKICVDVFGAISPSKVPTSAQLNDLFSDKKRDSGDEIEVGFINGNMDKEKNSECKDSESPVGQKVIHQAELESQLFKYEGTFAEYLEMLTQLGHVVLFSTAFPLAALCAMLNNAAEVRADAFKLCHVAQRPFGERVNTIGSWQHAMEALVCVAVLVNCALIGLSGPVHRLLPDATPAQTILVVVALEHIILVIALALRLAIPEIPTWLATEMAKVEFQRREAIKNAHAPLMSECASQDDISKQSARGTPRTITPTTPKAKQEESKPEKKKINIGKIPEIPPFRPKAASITDPAVATGSLQVLQDISPTKPLRHKLNVERKASKTSPAPVGLWKLFTGNYRKSGESYLEGGQVKVKLIAERFDLTAGILHNTICDHLHVLKVPARLVPRMLTPHQKETCMECYLQLELCVPLSLLGVRGLRDEPLHRSAHCIPHPTQHRPMPAHPAHKELAASVVAGGSEPELSAVPSVAHSAASVASGSSEDDKPKDKGRSRAKAALVSRVRSVALFSLGLKRAREAAAERAPSTHTPRTPEKTNSLGLPAPNVGWRVITHSHRTAHTSGRRQTASGTKQLI